MQTIEITDTRRSVDLINGGARRGAHAMATALADYHRNGVFQLSTTYVDPSPGRAVAMRDEVRSLGLPAVADERGIEEYLALESPPKNAVLVLHLDSPKAIARAIELSDDMPILSYTVLYWPTGHVTGLHSVISPEDFRTRHQLAHVYRRFADVTARAGSSAIFGERAPAANRDLEPLYRQAFANHLRANLPKLAACLEPESPSVEMTFDGRVAEPVVILDSETAWLNETELRESIPRLITTPVAPGQGVLVCEVGPDGIRIHRALLRRIDRTLEVRTITGVDPRLTAALATADRLATPVASRTDAILPVSLMAGALLMTD